MPKEKSAINVPVMIYLPPDLKDKLTVYCKMKNVSMSRLLRRYITRLLKKAEEENETVSFNDLVEQAKKARENGRSS